MPPWSCVGWTHSHPSPEGEWNLDVEKSIRLAIAPSLVEHWQNIFQIILEGVRLKDFMAGPGQ